MPPSNAFSIDELTSPLSAATASTAPSPQAKRIIAAQDAAGASPGRAVKAKAKAALGSYHYFLFRLFMEVTHLLRWLQAC